MAAEHLAIVTTEMARLMLAGVKTVESRLTRTRRAPFGCVRPGDIVHFKITGGDIIGQWGVEQVEEYDALTPSACRGLQRRYASLVAASSEYWAARRTCRYAVFIWLGGRRSPRRRIEVPRQYGAGWLLLPSVGGVQN